MDNALPHTAASAANLAELARRVDGLAASAARRRKLITVGGVLLALLTAGYLGFAWWQIDRTLRADTVVAMAEQQAAPYLNQPATAWASQLEAQAPALMDAAGAAALDAPTQLSQQVLGYVESAIDEQMPQLEEDFGTLISRLVEQADEAAGAEFKKGEFDEAQAAELLDRVAAQFGSSLQGEVDKIYGRYTDVSAGLIGQLDRLAQGQGLSEKERLHRDLITSFLALLQRAPRGGPSLLNGIGG